jgi:hypothetical protein
MSRPASTQHEVISLARHPGYRPDFRRLASAQVKAAREKLRLDPAGFAGYLSGMLGWDVRPGTVSRWEQGTGTPPGDVVLAAAVATQTDDRDPPEGVTPWADRGLIPRQHWNDAVAGARTHLWLYGMAELGYAEDDETPTVMAAATAAGCAIRVLLLDPAWAGITGIDEAEGNPAGTLAARIRAGLARFGQMRAACEGLQIRTYDMHPTVSVVRGDDRMLVTPYLRFSPGANSPTFELTARSAPRMFGRYERHFEAAWDLAREAA